MAAELQQLEAGIRALEAQRGLLGDAVVDSMLVPARARLAALIAEALAPAPPADSVQTLKQVSILFLDVVGSTALAQQLDPEAVSAVMDDALTRGTGIVQTHCGRVLQYAGDNILAAFGADESREDDAERAVQCGLALLALGQALGAEVLARHGRAGIDVRVGIHTGGVLLGGGVDAEGTIRGSAVNIAARMEQAAPAGTLRISHDTYRHVRGVFDVLAQPPLQVKGIEEPVVTYLVQRAKPRTFRVATRGIEGLETRMIGRDAELAQLQATLRQVCQGRQARLITIMSDAGLGKSRLLYEFQNWAEAQAEVFVLFQGRATPATQSQPFGLLRDILAWRFEIADGDSMAVACRKLEDGVSPLFEDVDGPELAQAHAHLLGQLIGLNFSASPHVRGILADVRQIRNRGFHAAAYLFRRAGARHDAPVVLQLENLHWADEGSLDFLTYLSQTNADMPLLTLALTRPTLLERRPEWLAGSGGESNIELLSLDKGASRLLVNELLKKLPEEPQALRELISGGGEGNPFYMEELVKMLVDQGAIRTGPGAWSVHPERLLATKVPGTLTGVLQARLDALPASERLALQQASVVGLVFWDQALGALDSRAPAALPALVRRELTPPRLHTVLEGMREFSFQHQILHNVTYGTLLKRSRRELHGRAAAWLAGLTSARASDFLAATAEHFEKAGDIAQACEYFTRAAEHATARHAQEAALAHARHALDLGGHTAPAGLRWRLLLVCEHAQGLQGYRDKQRASLAQLQQLADALDDDVSRTEVAIRETVLENRTGDHRGQERAARRALALASATGNPELRLRAHHLLCVALTYLGDPVAESDTLEGLVQARALGLRGAEGKCLNVLAGIASQQGQLLKGLELNLQSLAIVRELGDLQSEAIGLSNIGSGCLELGDLDQADQHLHAGLRLLRAVGNRAIQPFTLATLSRLALCRSDDGAALAHARAAVDVAIAVQARDWQAYALCSLGSAELALGRHDAAVAAFEQAHAMGVQIGQLSFQLDATAGLARVALDRADPARALRVVQPLLSHLEAGGSLEGARSHSLLRLTCVQVLQRNGDERADALLVHAHTELQAVSDTLADPALRRGYLSRVPENREIVALFSSRG